MDSSPMPIDVRAVLVVTPLLLAACEASPGPERMEREPVLEFPEAGLDDPVAYEGYATRFFRDSRGNTFQIYLDARDGRVVHVWADAANESLAFTVRDTAGAPVPVTWAGPGAVAESDGDRRAMRHRLAAEAGALEIGWFLLGSMRQERDFQYQERHLRPYTDPPFVLPELTSLVASVERLPPEERVRHLALLGVPDTDGLRSRLEPQVRLVEGGEAGDGRGPAGEEEAAWTVLVEQPGLDGRNLLTLELSGDPGASTARLEDGVVVVRGASPGAPSRARSGGSIPSRGPIELGVTVTTDSEPLTPLARERLFNDAFEAYRARRRRAADSLRRTLSAEEAAADPRLAAFRRFERQARGLELLSSEQKLMASMPNYATYFGRDQMMSALMLEPISSVDLQELVIASVLRKLDPSGNVSHEEALGGQAIREHAAEYGALVGAWEEERDRDPEAAEEHLARARATLEDLQAVRENYRMVDDDFQLPVLLDRYLSRADVLEERKRRFLSSPAGGGARAGRAATGGPAAPGAPVVTRLDAAMRNLAFVARLAQPYAEEPIATNLVAFFHSDDEGPLPGSWRDSRAGYGNGRFAMDVNAVWVPAALEASGGILRAIEDLGFSAEDALARTEEAVVRTEGAVAGTEGAVAGTEGAVARGGAGAAARGGAGAAALAGFVRDPETLREAIATWRDARRHFEVRLSPGEIRARLEAWLASLPGPERAYWGRRFPEREPDGGPSPDAGGGLRPLTFLALSLDAEGRPVPAPNTDPATELFLADHTASVLGGTMAPGEALGRVEAFARPYPVGLLVEGLGPVVVNDAYAGPAVQRRFREDLYHSPRVVWGREVNLLLLGLARQIEAAYDASGRARADDEAVLRYVESLRGTLEATREAVEASGLRHNELWSYRIEGEELRPVRYGTSSDIQLWNVTDLAVAFLLDRLPPR